MLKQESSYIWFMRFFYIFLALLGFSTQLTAQKMFVAESSSTALEEDSSSIHKLYIRPFITDDARVVGKKLAQLESWVRFDKEAGQHWLLGAYGPNKKLEITVGGVYGYQNEHNSKKTFAYALPLLQAKFLFKEYKPNKGPGLGMAVGTFLPVGQGSFKPDGYGTFGYFIVSQCFGKGEQFLFHGNLGGNYLHVDGSNNLIATWGIGTQIKAYKGLHFVGEIFSGDPYIPGTGTSWQAGYRYIVSDFLQIDMTIGNGIAGTTKMPFWFSAGVRIVRENLF
ncbi:hypothetical protein [Sediminibacterium sp. TEGAF015]|uniref:hypothetical protein n=1 Tax=Sediminibacterium sp. TEGAF015 TaxID=575378 RepID=UPI0022310FA4|nr:hypothetical protein [Sediminibacterium sp. TEGAF015]